MRQSLINLLTNAIKFTPEGGSVRLVAESRGAMLTIAISDTGIGIAPEDAPHIFEREFVSTRVAHMGKHGGGLGLAAAKAIIEQHGGTLTFTSRLDAGATFIIALPGV